MMNLADEIAIWRGRNESRRGSRDWEEVETEAHDLEAIDVEVLSVVSICSSPSES